MHLTSGTRLGAYEIVGPIGAGGMGEVYRARDTRLDRTVALKILPARFGEKPELRERFERETRVVSNLNHPNICALYDVGEQDGVAYFVMEYLDGQSLADRVSNGPLPLEQALRVAIDIANALAVAHRHGIVHRDLKPGNVMLTKTGAKLLDFGLARASSETAAVRPDDPTVAAQTPLTAEGTIVGTLQYMSPEQLEGRALDARSDIFAFGAVVYEMVTGRRAFSGTSQATLITSIMSGTPRPVRELQPVTPLALERIISRCLEKDPDNRWQCASDLVAELRTISAAANAPRETTRRSILPWALAALLLITTAVLAALLMRQPAPRQELIRFDLTAASRDVSFVGFEPLNVDLAVSPDGTRVVYVALQGSRRALWLRTLTEPKSRLIEGTANAEAPFWSPDGRSLGFFAMGKLQVLDVGSGTVRTVCDLQTNGAPAGAWSSDGSIVITDAVLKGNVHAVAADGGAPRPLFPLPAGYTFHFPQFLSDGKRFLFTASDAKRPSLWLGSTQGGPPRKIADDISRVQFVAPYAVFVHDGTLVAQRFDERELALTGPRVPLAHDVRNYKHLGGSAHAAGGRTIVVFPFADPAHAIWMDRTGKVMGNAAADADYHQVRVARDGRKALAALIDRKTGLSALWTLDIARKNLRRASVDAIDHERPVWSPDGTQIAFVSDVGGLPHIYVHDVAGGNSREITPVGKLQFTRDWSESAGIIYVEFSDQTGSDIMTVSPQDKTPKVWLRTPFNEPSARVSPDGRSMAFISDESGAAELYVAPFDRPRDSVRLTSGGARLPAWSGDGREIYFLRGRREMFAVTPTGEPVHLFTTTADILDYDVAPDGRFLIAQADDRSEQKRLQVIVNWQSEIEKDAIIYFFHLSISRLSFFVGRPAPRSR